MHKMSFMIDTGAIPNLIKKRVLLPGVSKKKQWLLTGLRMVTLKPSEPPTSFREHPVILQVIDNNFPINQNRILESDFLRNASNINFLEQTIV